MAFPWPTACSTVDIKGYLSVAPGAVGRTVTFDLADSSSPVATVYASCSITNIATACSATGVTALPVDTTVNIRVTSNLTSVVDSIPTFGWRCNP